MSDEPDPAAERRAFLKAAGKFAVTVPPAMTFLLTTTLRSEAIAQSNGTFTHNSAPNNEQTLETLESSDDGRSSGSWDTWDETSP